MQVNMAYCCLFIISFVMTVAQRCKAPLTSVVKFSINSRQNVTGHWIAQMQMEHGGGKKEGWPWAVDVEHKTFKCGEDESLLVSANIIAPIFGSGNATISRPPPVGYQLVSGLGFNGYYKLHTDLKTWYEALKSCEKEGAHLAIFNSEAEAKALSPLWDANPKIQDGGGNNWAHVGFHDIYLEGQYVTIFNESLAVIGYMKWNAGEPGENVGENCGVSYRRDNLLGDITCEARMPYFCELELE